MPVETAVFANSNSLVTATAYKNRKHSPEKSRGLKVRYCPSLDAVGINTYGGIVGLREAIAGQGFAALYLYRVRAARPLAGGQDRRLRTLAPESRIHRERIWARHCASAAMSGLVRCFRRPKREKTTDLIRPLSGAWRSRGRASLRCNIFGQANGRHI
jgi:hypothetical protein